MAAKTWYLLYLNLKYTALKEHSKSTQRVLKEYSKHPNLFRFDLHNQISAAWEEYDGALWVIIDDFL